ncbi:hypothetical protein JL720_7585 [Aureococcus anophagefferens]|nr:hypothetical protein JL720_7585 [Aureococcus anophagefferens]
MAGQRAAAPAPALLSGGRLDSCISALEDDEDSHATPTSVSRGAPVELEKAFAKRVAGGAFDGEDDLADGDVPLRVDALERGCVRLRRDVKTVWSLERAFEARMADECRGWSEDIANMRDGVVDEIRAGQAAAVEGALEQTQGKLDDATRRLAGVEGGVADEARAR